MSPGALVETAAAQAADQPHATILVSLYLGGGNDGLNTLVPLRDPAYRRLRPRLAISPDDALPLPDLPDFGWHPALTGVRTLYDQGKVAVLPAVDYHRADLSHFDSAAYWRTGVVGDRSVRTGWLGRTLDVLGSEDNPLQGVSATWTLDPVLAAQRVPVATVYEPTDYDFYVRGVSNREAVAAAYRIATEGPAPGMLGAVRAAYRSSFRVAQELAPLAASPDGEPPVAYPATLLGARLRSLARLLGAGLGTRVAAVYGGGSFDTHGDQPEEHAALLRDLGDALVAWQADLVTRGLSGRVLTLVWSEFGRRPQENDSLGTDHGAGGVVLLVGDRANGGLRSEFPGLGRLDANDNLRVSTDFRTVYATLLESWLGVDAAAILPRVARERLDLVRP